MILFNRHTSCQVEQIAKNELVVSVNLCDSHHEITVFITVLMPEAQIILARAEFLRSPDKICARTATLMEGLVGQSLGQGVIKMASNVLGGPQGCIHLKELVIEAAKALFQAKYIMRFGDYPDYSAINKALAKDQAGTCYLYSQPDPEADVTV